jgi:hypothetical protein
MSCSRAEGRASQACSATPECNTCVSMDEHLNEAFQQRLDRARHAFDSTGHPQRAGDASRGQPLPDSGYTSWVRMNSESVGMQPATPSATEQLFASTS